MGPACIFMQLRAPQDEGCDRAATTSGTLEDNEGGAPTRLSMHFQVGWQKAARGYYQPHRRLR